LPTETGRVIARKRITLPSGATVDVPVIAQIKFLDVVDQGQESQFSVENSAQANRDTRSASVSGGGTAPNETGADSSGLQVERIDIWRVRDVVAQGQETFFAPDNKTFDSNAVPDFKTPYFITHEQTHVVKYINTPDDGHWIKSELIDKWKYRDVVDQAQETEFFLSNPPDNQSIDGITVGNDGTLTTVAVDPNLPDISDSNNGVDPPWRLDPFQNIVDFQSGAQFLLAEDALSPDGLTITATARLWWSSDGIQWTEADGVPSLDQLQSPSVIYGNGMWCVLFQFFPGSGGNPDLLNTTVVTMTYDGKTFFTVFTYDVTFGGVPGEGVTFDLQNNRWVIVSSSGPPPDQHPVTTYFPNPNPPSPWPAPAPPATPPMRGAPFSVNGNPAESSAVASSIGVPLPSAVTAIRFYRNDPDTNISHFDYTNDEITDAIRNSGRDWPLANWTTSFVSQSVGGANTAFYGQPGKAPVTG
jgi:hypothetical protein